MILRSGRRSHTFDSINIVLSSTDLMEYIMLVKSDDLLVQPSLFTSKSSNNSNRLSFINIHNGLMPTWHYNSLQDLYRMKAVCKLWQIVSSKSIQYIFETLLSWAKDCPEPFWVQVPSSEENKFYFISTMPNGKFVLVHRQQPTRAGDKILFNFEASETGQIKKWLLTQLLLISSTSKVFITIHRHLFHKLQPHVVKANKRAKLHTLSPVQVKNLLLQHVNKCRSPTCVTCQKIRQRIRNCSTIL